MFELFKLLRLQGKVRRLIKSKLSEKDKMHRIAISSCLTHLIFIVMGRIELKEETATEGRIKITLAIKKEMGEWYEVIVETLKEVDRWK